MTEVIKAKFKDFHKDEIADSEKYRTLAKEISDSDPEIAGILRDIADDENTHANAFDYILQNFT